MSSAHPSPDPHRLPDPSSTRSRRGPGNGSRILVYLLFALALIATVIMFFADSDVWLNIAVIAALWAAFFGAVLVSRYSGALGEEETRTRERDARHAAELDAERADHRRREAELQQSLEGQGGQGRDETLESIRAELAALRSQLSELSGLDLGEDQVAVRARAERIIELERRSGDTAGTTGTAGATGAAAAGSASPATSAPAATPSSPSSVSASPAASPQPEREDAPVSPFRTKTTTTDRPRSGARRGGFATGTFSAVSWTGTDSDETSMIPLVVDTRDSSASAAGAAETAEKARESAGENATGKAAPQTPWTGRDGSTAGASARAPETSTESSAASSTGSSAAQAAEQTSEAGHHRRAAEPDSRGRRRADERPEGNSSVTVAELMAQLKKNAR